jgi:hypothetical protein
MIMITGTKLTRHFNDLIEKIELAPTHLVSCGSFLEACLGARVWFKRIPLEAWPEWI